MRGLHPLGRRGNPGPDSSGLRGDPGPIDVQVVTMAVQQNKTLDHGLGGNPGPKDPIDAKTSRPATPAKPGLRGDTGSVHNSDKIEVMDTAAQVAGTKRTADDVTRKDEETLSYL